VSLAAVEFQQLSVGGAATQHRLRTVESEVCNGCFGLPLEARDRYTHVRTAGPSAIDTVGGVDTSGECVTERFSGAGGVLMHTDGAVQPGEDVLALGGHATAGIEGTVAGTLDTGVIFTAEIRALLSERGTPRVLFATSGTFTSSQGLWCLAGPASWCW